MGGSTIQKSRMEAVNRKGRSAGFPAGVRRLESQLY